MKTKPVMLALLSFVLANAKGADLWKTTFIGSSDSNRTMVNATVDPSFTDALNADDFNLKFEDTTFNGAAFTHIGAMASGTYYSPQTDVDNPGVASPQNGGWWQTDFRYAGGAQTVNLSGVALEMTWSNSSGDIQLAGNDFGNTVRDITLTAQYSLDGGLTWTDVASPQTYDVTEADNEDQIQVRTFNSASPITVNHATQDLWLRVRAENANGTAGAYVNIKSITFQGGIVSSTGFLWSTNFTGSNGNGRNLINNNGDASFTDTLDADDYNLTFQDTTFTGTVFMHSGSMGSGLYYSPRTNVDNPGASGTQNGGWWQADFRYAGGAQTVNLSAIALEMTWSNSGGNIQTTGNSYGTNIRDIILTAQYSLDGGVTWTNVADPQTYDVTEPDNNDQIQLRTFTPASAITVNHATQDLWLRVRAENTGTSIGAYVDIKSIAFQGSVVSSTGVLWTTNFSGADGNDRSFINNNGDFSFTDALSGNDANLAFEDASFTDTVFMHTGNMGSGLYYSPRTNVDNPAAADPQNGGWWQSEFRYSGGSQTVLLSDLKLEMTWSNSSGNIQTIGNNYGINIRDITLTVEYSIDGGANWANMADPQIYDLTEPDGQDQVQILTFTPASAITVNHSTQDLWLRVKAENANGTQGGYVNIKSIAFIGSVQSLTNDYTLWAQTYPGADLTDPDADADGDGQTNNEERLWGLNPTSGASPSAVTSTLNPATRALTYTRRNPSLTNASFTYEYSTNLSNWLPFTPASVSASGASPVESVTIEVPAGIMGPKFFVRILATGN